MDDRRVAVAMAAAIKKVKKLFEGTDFEEQVASTLDIVSLEDVDRLAAEFDDNAATCAQNAKVELLRVSSTGAAAPTSSSAVSSSSSSSAAAPTSSSRGGVLVFKCGVDGAVERGLNQLVFNRGGAVIVKRSLGQLVLVKCGTGGAVERGVGQLVLECGTGADVVFKCGLGQLVLVLERGPVLQCFAAARRNCGHPDWRWEQCLDDPPARRIDETKTCDSGPGATATRVQRRTRSFPQFLSAGCR
eukprot:TRINITY_DN2866_c0_g1_i2.p2 TRINITY_DN2866_c0_g1~~TRINITY_DN2866_c0_g1_i2.p2  ORF type:complete len:265 (+),score=76.57 TRINITY_DN2866_c0_g1_i2:61-795(+)